MLQGLEKVLYVNTESVISNKGTSIPPYYPNFNVADWYIDSSSSYFYNIVNNDEIFIQYGKDVTGWASARFFREKVTIIDEEILEDGTINATILIEPLYFIGRPNLVGSTGYRVEYEVYFNNQLGFTYIGNTRGSFDNGPLTPIEINITVAPEEVNYQGAFDVQIHYPDGQFTDSRLVVGIGLRNPNPKTYVPMAIRKSNQWKDLNRNNGVIKIRKSNTWIDKSEENRNDSKQVNKGKNRIRKSNQWRQLPPMENENPI